jgi:eukaryotic-like serine/threonine-protein kinase
MAFDVASKRPIKLAGRPDKQSKISGARFSPDGKWVAFVLSETGAHRSRVFIIPFDSKRVAPFAEWAAVSEYSHFAAEAAWAPEANLIYFTSERDGFRCIWARRLNAITRTPRDESFPVRHFHSARQSLGTGLDSGGNRMAFTVMEPAGIWLEETAAAKLTAAESMRNW